jgi:Na+/proline symporter
MIIAISGEPFFYHQGTKALRKENRESRTIREIYPFVSLCLCGLFYFPTSFYQVSRFFTTKALRKENRESRTIREIYPFVSLCLCGLFYFPTSLRSRFD